MSDEKTSTGSAPASAWRSRRGVIVAVGAALTLLVCSVVAGVMAFYATDFLNPLPYDIEIPDVVGTTVGDARRMIEVRTEVAFVEGTGTPGIVVKQSHAPGTMTHHDDIVHLEVAGPVRVPDVVGYDLRIASDMLAATGLQNTYSEWDTASPLRAGTVTSQTPKPGELVLDVNVSLTVAGPAPY